jgi:hypothetical protein
MGAFNNNPTVMVVGDSDDTRFMPAECLVLKGVGVWRQVMVKRSWRLSGAGAPT